VERLAEAALQAEEEKRRAEAARQAEEEKRRAEAARQAEEEMRRAEAARQAEEEKRRTEAARPAWEKKPRLRRLGALPAVLCRLLLAFRRRREDLVDVSAFAPEGGVAGSEILVQVLLHRLDDSAIVEERARAADPDAIRRGIATLVTEIPRGKRVDIVLEGRDTTIDEPLQSIVWRGEPCAVQFFVTLPETTTDRSCNLRVRIFLDEIPVGSLRFALISAAAPINLRSFGIRGDTAARYHRAFLSYATPDRSEVLKRAQALRAAHIEFFQDFLSIDPGERWERKLYKEINFCDLFLLFWSTNAAQSEWVLREAELAVARQNASSDEEPDIMPIILEGPPVPQPIPDFLKHLQFNDYLAYLITAADRERGAST